MRYLDLLGFCGSFPYEFQVSDSVGIRTQDPQIRNLLLYPAELRNQTIGCFGNEGKSLHFQSICKINQYYANCEKKRRILYYS